MSDSHLPLVPMNATFQLADNWFVVLVIPVTSTNLLPLAFSRSVRLFGAWLSLVDPLICMRVTLIAMPHVSKERFLSACSQGLNAFVSRD